MDELKIVLHGERPPSWNKFYAGSHWRERKQDADRIHLLVLAALNGRPARMVKPVEIVVTAFFKGRQFDPCNVPAKIYIDGLVQAGLLVDDTPRYVDSVTTRSRKDKDRPRVEILIREAA
jgi:hypothetical protein